MFTDEFNEINPYRTLMRMQYGSAETIDCGHGRAVTFSYGGGEAYERAKKDPTVVGKTGAAFVSAMLALSDNGIESCTRTLNGSLHDGPNGEPSRIHFVQGGGTAVQIDHFIDGEQVTCQLFAADGKTTTQMEYYKDGKPSQGPNGESGHKSYYKSGAPFAQIDYDEAGQRVEEKKFHENGQVETHTIYKNDKYSDEKRYDEKGILKSHWMCKDDGSHTVQLYDQNGAPIDDRPTANGANKGPARIVRGIKSAIAHLKR